VSLAVVAVDGPAGSGKSSCASSRTRSSREMLPSADREMTAPLRATAVMLAYNAGNDRMAKFTSPLRIRRIALSCLGAAA